MSEPAVSYDFEPLEPSDPPPRDAQARLLAQALADAEEIRERARTEGFEAGHAAGLEQGTADLRAAGGVLAAAAGDVRALGEEAVQTVEQDAIELGLELAGKILAGAFQARPELVVEVVQGALRRISDRRRITVLVNPGDLDVVRGAIGDLTSQGSGVEHCDVQSDERIAPGSAIVRTIEGEVDASVHTQLERAREVAEGSLQSGEHGA